MRRVVKILFMIGIACVLFGAGVFMGSIRRHADTATQTQDQATAQTTTCRLDQLAASLQTPAGGGAAGSNYRTLVLTNTSDAGCTLTGYPGVSLIADNDAQIGRAASRSADRTSTTLTIAAGKTAQADVRFTDPTVATDCQTGATALKMYPPDVAGYLTVPITGISYCPGFSVSALYQSSN